MSTITSKIEAYVGRKVDFVKEVELLDDWDGNGPYINSWNIDGVAKPTVDQLNALETEAQSIDDEVALNYLRHARNIKLAETDWTQNRDVTLANDADWQTYRQALRDITDTYTSLDDVVWPEKP